MTTLVSGTPARGDMKTGRLRVPWGTVLPLAVVAAYGSGFWIVALRGATGAIERTSEPFTAWLHESTLLLPLYVFAVVGALALALRWFGRSRQRTRATAATYLLVVAAATVVGILVLTASVAYDYQLQTADLATTHALHGTCNAECHAAQQQATLTLQVRAVGFGSLMMVASNLVLLGLVVGFRGGRLDVASTRSHPIRVLTFRRAGLDDLQMLVAAALLAAAVIHATVVREHLAEWPAAGVFFLLLTIAELTLAVLVLLRFRSAAVLVTAVVLSAGPILLWLHSRTLGMPFGPEAGVPEQIGLADTAASLLEAVTLAAVAVAVRRSRQPPRRPTSSEHLSRLALVAVVAIAVSGLAGDLALVGDPGHTGHGTETTSGTPQ